MLKYVVSIAFAALFSLNTKAEGYAVNFQAGCNFKFSGNLPKIDVLLYRMGGIKFPGSEAVCIRLRDANARVGVVMEYGVMGGKAFGWATVSLVDGALPIFGAVVTQTTRIDDTGTELVALNQMGEILTDSIAALDVTLALEHLEIARKKVFEASGKVAAAHGKKANIR